MDASARSSVGENGLGKGATDWEPENCQPQKDENRGPPPQAAQAPEDATEAGLAPQGGK